MQTEKAHQHPWELWRSRQKKVQTQQRSCRRNLQRKRLLPVFRLQIPKLRARLEHRFLAALPRHREDGVRHRPISECELARQRKLGECEQCLGPTTLRLLFHLDARFSCPFRSMYPPLPVRSGRQPSIHPSSSVESDRLLSGLGNAAQPLPVQTRARTTTNMALFLLDSSFSPLRCASPGPMRMRPP